MSSPQWKERLILTGIVSEITRAVQGLNRFRYTFMHFTDKIVIHARFLPEFHRHIQLHLVRDGVKVFSGIDSLLALIAILFAIVEDYFPT